MDYIIQKYEKGNIILSQAPDAEPSLNTLQISKELQHITQISWNIVLSETESSGMTKRQEIQNAKKQDMEMMKENKIVKAIFTHFPDAKMANIYNLD